MEMALGQYAGKKTYHRLQKLPKRTFSKLGINSQASFGTRVLDYKLAVEVNAIVINYLKALKKKRLNICGPIKL